ncbi:MULTISPECIES: helix-turn-helix transcriptional regulator [unclassified Rhizobium]|uniref:helix-turn-helix domain-containing protein n=1 Tax=unclassified Rhizobium TaxID=2613769 RepID=UPI000EA92C9A|nr:MULTISPECIES: helix-turn-helix transcriptional regulator [unclassified Rhizobium]AYG69915.1 XRE family transcriptional regulator [Rhizobium sp. CCGE531]AYG76292.1 XRE family transcriptional regulator [Rhizobium sp. CCGE532]
MSFRFEIGARARAASRFIANVRSDLIAAAVERRSQTGFTQQQLAELVGVSRQELNRYFCGQRELPLRSIADLAWALDKEIHVELRDPAGSTESGCLAQSEIPAETRVEAQAAVHSTSFREVISWSSSRAIRTIVARAIADRDD